MSTARDLIKSALKSIGALGVGQTPTAAEEADALGSLNRMLGSWSVEGLLIFKFTREVFPLVAGKSSYTMGEAGDFNTIRPIEIRQAAATDVETVVTELTPFIPGDPLAIPPVPDTPATYRTDYYSKFELGVENLNIQQWSSIVDKRLQSTYVQKIYVQDSSPLVTLNVFPVPSTSSGLVLYSLKQFVKIENVNDELDLPSGYDEALEYNLAIRLAPQYGKTVAAETLSIANDSKANIKTKNAEPLYLVSDAYKLVSGKCRFDWRTGK